MKLIILIVTFVVAGFLTTYFVSENQSTVNNKQEAEDIETNTQTARTDDALVPDINEVSEPIADADITPIFSNTIDLHGTNLSTVPMDIFKKTNTEVLNLSSNSLTGALPAEVRHLQKLRVLDLSDNAFTGVPAEVGQLQNLEVLDLSNNPITGLPYELGHLHSLQVLDLRGTQFSQADLEIIIKTLPATVTIKR